MSIGKDYFILGAVGRNGRIGACVLTARGRSETLIAVGKSAARVELLPQMLPARGVSPSPSVSKKIIATEGLTRPYRKPTLVERSSRPRCSGKLASRNSAMKRP